jgi:hypothetical protein
LLTHDHLCGSGVDQVMVLMLVVVLVLHFIFFTVLEVQFKQV